MFQVEYAALDAACLLGVLEACIRTCKPTTGKTPITGAERNAAKLLDCRSDIPPVEGRTHSAQSGVEDDAVASRRAEQAAECSSGSGRAPCMTSVT